MAIQYNIEQQAPKSGRMIKEDNTLINEADLWSAAFSGNAGMVVQPFTEANIKRGVQYYLRAAYPTASSVAGGESKKILFATGAKPVLVKLRVFEYIGEEFSISLFSNPVVTGSGDPVTVSNWNVVNPVATTSSARKNVTTSSDGTQIGDTEYFFGSQQQNSRDVHSIPEGRERVIPANSEFLVVIKNENGQSGRCQYFLDWYEGGTDIP